MQTAIWWSTFYWNYLIYFFLLMQDLLLGIRQKNLDRNAFLDSNVFIVFSTNDSSILLWFCCLYSVRPSKKLPAFIQSDNTLTGVCFSKHCYFVCLLRVYITQGMQFAPTLYSVSDATHSSLLWVELLLLVLM